MKFIIFVKSDQQMETGALPDVSLFAEMDKYNNKLKEAGVLLDLNGLLPSSKGIRISFSENKTTIQDGPFENPTELVAGYWIIKVETKEEAIKWAEQIPFTDGIVEIRQIQEISNFPQEIQEALNKN